MQYSVPAGGVRRRTLWITMKGFRLHPSSFPGLCPVARVVYAKPPFGGPQQVLAYLGRYTHRVAIANSRLISLSDGKVSFSWKDYRQNSKTKVMTLNAEEFIRRFLLHSLPDGFHRIRHYGFFANGERSDRLELCRGCSRLGMLQLTDKLLAISLSNARSRSAQIAAVSCDASG